MQFPPVSIYFVSDPNTLILPPPDSHTSPAYVLLLVPQTKLHTRTKNKIIASEYFKQAELEFLMKPTT